MPKRKPYKLDRVAIRMVKEPPLYSEEPLSNPETAIKILRDVFKEYDREVVCVVNLKTNMQPVNLNIVSIGAIDQAIVHPRELLKSSILANAASVLIMHTHPSGNLTPSTLDISMTDRMQQVFSIMGIDIVDHIIIGDNDNYYSFREHQEMPVGQPHYTAELAEIKLKEYFPLKPESVLDQLSDAKEQSRKPQSVAEKEIRKTNSREAPGR
jgi:proteasome lid subunit RPN8/RPN11